MKRTQIQLSDDLYERVKRLAADREMTLTEVVRRSLESFLQRYPAPGHMARPWKLPFADLGGIKIDLARLHDITAEEETMRSFPLDTEKEAE